MSLHFIEGVAPPSHRTRNSYRRKKEVAEGCRMPAAGRNPAVLIGLMLLLASCAFAVSPSALRPMTIPYHPRCYTAASLTSPYLPSERRLRAAPHSSRFRVQCELRAGFTTGIVCCTGDVSVRTDPLRTWLPPECGFVRVDTQLPEGSPPCFPRTCTNTEPSTVPFSKALYAYSLTSCRTCSPPCSLGAHVYLMTVDDADAICRWAA